MRPDLRGFQSPFTVFGARIDIAPYLADASSKVGHIVGAQLQESLRKEDSDIDTIVLVGGGAPFYEAAIKAAFHQVPVTVAHDSVFANARGFWRGGAA